jgi:RNA polymerase sigma factor (sigma-70 family)
MRPEELPGIAFDGSIFEAFYREYVESVQRFIVRRVDDPHLAADLTAEVFVAAIKSAATYRGDGAPRAWLLGIARVVVAADLRSRAHEQRVVRRIEGRRLLESDDIARIQERVDAAAQARLLYAALGGLPDGERAVLELIALDDLSIAEAATALGILPCAARVRLHRARTTLRDELKAEDSTILVRPMEVSP